MKPLVNAMQYLSERQLLLMGYAGVQGEVNEVGPAWYQQEGQSEHLS